MSYVLKKEADDAEFKIDEETGIEITNLKAEKFTNDTNIPYEKHYVTIFVVANYKSGDPKILEPDKCEKWEWFAWDELPKPLFYAIQNFVDAGFKVD